MTVDSSPTVAPAVAFVPVTTVSSSPPFGLSTTVAPSTVLGAGWADDADRTSPPAPRGGEPS